MKSFFKFLPILLFLVVFFSCEKNDEKESTNPVSQAENNSDNTHEILQEIIVEEKTLQEYYFREETYPQEYPREEKYFFGITCFTNVLEDDVDVRENPWPEADIVFQLQKDSIIEIQGFSNETSTIDNYYGNWIYILYKESDYEYLEGWVFSKYINFGDIKPSLIKFAGFVKNREYGSTRIKTSFIFNGYEYFNENYGGYGDKENNYIIIGPSEHGYHYSFIPGIYSLNKKLWN